MNKVLIIIKKELRSIFRNKKVLLSLFVYPILIPFMVILYGNMANIDTKEETDNNIGVNYTLSEEEKAIINNYNINVVEYKTVDELKDAYENGEIGMYITYNNTTYTLHVDSSTTDGILLKSLAESYLEAYDETLTKEYLIANNIDLNAAYDHFNIEYDEISQTNYMIKLVFSVCLTYAILAIAVSCGNVSVSANASEKENGTLETILTFPIEKKDLLVGKYLSSTIVGFIAGIVSLVLLIISLLIGKAYFTIFSEYNIILNFKSIFGSFIIVSSAAIFIASLSFFLTANSKTTLEAQSKIGYLTAVGIIPMIVDMLEIGTNTFYYLIPICNYERILSDLFTSSVTAPNIILTFLSSVIYTYVIVKLIVKTYNSENIMFKN